MCRVSRADEHGVVGHAGQVGARGGRGQQRQAGEQIGRVVADQAHRTVSQDRRRGQRRQRGTPPVLGLHPHPVTGARTATVTPAIASARPSQLDGDAPPGMPSPTDPVR